MCAERGSYPYYRTPSLGPSGSSLYFPPPGQGASGPYPHYRPPGPGASQPEAQPEKTSCEIQVQLIKRLQELRVEQGEIIKDLEEALSAREKANQIWEKAIEEVYENIRGKEKANWELKNQVRDQLRSQEGKDTFLWRIPNIPAWRDFPNQESPLFQTTPTFSGHRYWLQATLHTQGVKEENEKPTHVAVGWKVVYGGIEDDFLEWPAKLQVQLVVRLPRKDSSPLKTFMITIPSEPEHPAYQRPKNGEAPNPQKIVSQFITLRSIEACVAQEGELHLSIMAQPCGQS